MTNLFLGKAGVNSNYNYINIVITTITILLTQNQANKKIDQISFKNNLKLYN